MGLGWKKLLPAALVLLFVIATVDTFRTPLAPRSGAPAVDAPEGAISAPVAGSGGGR
jgi:hypothetical protein